MPRSFIRGVQIGAQQVTNTNVLDATLRGTKISPFGLTSPGIFGDNVIETRIIVDDAVTTDKINNLAVTTDKIGDLAVTTGKIGDGQVTTLKVADQNITNAKLGVASVGTTAVQDLAVTTGKIDDLAVTTGKLDDEAVTTGKIGDLQVTTDKLGNESVTDTKLADDAVINSKLGTDSVDARVIESGAIEPQHFSTDAIDAVVESRVVDVQAFNVDSFTLGSSAIGTTLAQADAPSGVVLDADIADSKETAGVVPGGNPLALKEAEAGVSPVIGNTVEYLEGLPANCGALIDAATNQQIAVELGGDPNNTRAVFVSVELGSDGVFESGFDNADNACLLRFFYIDDNGEAVAATVPAGTYQFFYGRRYQLGNLPPRILQGSTQIVDNVASADVTLQNAYQNTLSDPEIVTNAARGPLDIERGADAVAALLRLDNDNRAIDVAGTVAAFELAGGTTNANAAGESVGIRIKDGYDVGLKVTGTMAIQANGGMSLVGNMTASGNIVPASDNTRNLGTPDLRFATGHFSQAVKVGDNTTTIREQTVEVRADGGMGWIHMDARDEAFMLISQGATGAADPGQVDRMANIMLYDAAQDVSELVLGHIPGEAPGVDRIKIAAGSGQNTMTLKDGGAINDRLRLLADGSTGELSFLGVEGNIGAASGLKVDTDSSDLLLTGAAVKVDTVLQSKGAEWSITKQTGNTEIASTNDLLLTASAVKVDTVLQDKGGNYQLFSGGTAHFGGAIDGTKGIVTIAPSSGDADGELFPTILNIVQPVAPGGAAITPGLTITGPGANAGAIIVGGHDSGSEPKVVVRNTHASGDAALHLDIDDVSKLIARGGANGGALVADGNFEIGVDGGKVLEWVDSTEVLTLGNSGATAVALDAKSIRFKDANIGPSTYTANYLALSNNVGEWDSYTTKFGPTASILHAINQAFSLSVDDLQEAYNNTPGEDVADVGSDARLIRVDANAPILVTGIDRQHAFVVGGTAVMQQPNSDVKFLDNSVALKGDGAFVGISAENENAGGQTVFSTLKEGVMSAMFGSFGAVDGVALRFDGSNHRAVFQSGDTQSQIALNRMGGGANIARLEANYTTGNASLSFLGTGVNHLTFESGTEKKVEFMGEGLVVASDKLILDSSAHIEAAANVLPDADNARTIGSSAARFATGFFNALKVGDATTTINDGSVVVDHDTQAFIQASSPAVAALVAARGNSNIAIGNVAGSGGQIFLAVDDSNTDRRIDLRYMESDQTSRLLLQAPNNNKIEAGNSNLTIDVTDNDLVLNGEAVKFGTTAQDENANWTINTDGEATFVDVAVGGKSVAFERAAYVFTATAYSIDVAEDTPDQGSLSVYGVTAASEEQFAKDLQIILNGQTLFNNNTFVTGPTGAVDNDVGRGTAGADSSKIFFGFKLLPGDIVQIFNHAPLKP